MSQEQATFTNADGSYRDYTQAEIDAIGILTRGVRDQTHPTHTRELNASTITRHFFCNYDYLERFVAYMLGAAKSYQDAGVYKISRILPQTYPGKPQFPAVKLVSARPFRFSAIVDEDGLPTYDKWECEVMYQHVPFAMLADAAVPNSGDERNRYVQVLPSQSEVNYLTLPGSVMSYKRQTGTDPPDTYPIPYGIGFPVPSATIRRKWVRVPYDLWGEGTNLFARVYGNMETGEIPFVGSVNTVELFGYPPGYLLYLGVEEELQMDPLGEALCWDLTHRWSAKYLSGHNWFYYHPVKAADGGNAGWYLAVKQGASWYDTASLPDNTALHNARDHRALFDVG